MKKYEKNLFYTIWCFFMDSRKGAAKYRDECNKELKRRNSGRHCTLITFRPYPGRFHWREWKIVCWYHNFKWKRNHPELKEFPLSFVRVSPSQIIRELIEYQQMPMPKGTIFFLKRTNENDKIY